MKCPETRTGDVTHHPMAMYQVSVEDVKGYGKICARFELVRFMGNIEVVGVERDIERIG